jgi:glucose/arabinose dehydrogenase
VRIPFSLIAALLVGLSWVFFTEPASAATLQPGFEDQIVTSVGSPTSLAFAPDGRMLLTSQSGQLRVLDKDGSLLESPALDLAAEICANPSSTKGLLGGAVDPSFETNNYIYVYYTFNKTGVALAPLSTGWPVTLSRATTSPPSTASW